MRVAEQFVHAARGDLLVEALLLLGGADDEFAVLSRDEIDERPANRPPHAAGQERPVLRWHVQPHDLPLDRAYGGSCGVRHAVDLTGAAPGGEYYRGRVQHSPI